MRVVEVSLDTANYNFQNFFQAQAGSTLAFGSDFHPVEQRRPLLHQHPGFNELAEILVTGIPYQYARKITETEREIKVIAMLARSRKKPRL